MLAYAEAKSTDPDFKQIDHCLEIIRAYGHSPARLFRRYPFGVGQYLQAVVEAQLGNKEKAMEYINECWDSGLYFYPNRYDGDPGFIPLFDYPSFQEFVKPRELVE